MNKILYLFISIFLPTIAFASDLPWSEAYQQTLVEKAAQKVAPLASYPSLINPDRNIQPILNKYPNDKVLFFGYGSLINDESATRTVGPETVKSIHPVIAFGFKRIFNYKGSNVSRWGNELPENEKAMLNIEPTTTYSHLINGVAMEVSKQDLEKLIQRETGYDLVPMLVANWNDVMSESPEVEIKIAYTFMVPDELRNGYDYTQTAYYPVRGYLHATQEGAATYGQKFLDFWNETTYLSDGTTLIGQWDEKTFSGILDTKKP